MEINNIKSISDKLSKYNYLATKDDDYIDLVEWTNGEGFTITIGNNPPINLADGEIDAIVHLRNCLRYGK